MRRFGAVRRAVAGDPLAWAAAAANAVVLCAVAAAAAAVVRAPAVDRLVRLTAAELIAEEAACFAVQRPVGDGARLGYRSLSGASCWIDARLEGGAPALEVHVDHQGRVHTFRCAVLDGGGPAALGVPLVLRRTIPRGEVALDPAPRRLGGPLAFPALDLPGRGECVEDLARRDEQIGLLHLRLGTDLDDYVLAPRASRGLRGVFEVPGHLWVEEKGGSGPIVLGGDVTVVVRGNLYVLGSLRARGRGRLMLVAAPAGVTSAAEGSGAVWFGLHEEDTRERTIRLDAGLVSHGEVHVAVRCVEVLGPVVGGRGITSHAGAARFRSGVGRLPDPARERLPGFARAGPARPGRLRPVR